LRERNGAINPLVEIGMDRTDYKYNLEYRANVRATVKALAESFLSGKLGLVETSRKLSEYQDMEPAFWEPLRVFIGIDSETDTLPVRNVRELWSPAALEAKDTETASVIRRWHVVAVAAAQELLRFWPPTHSVGYANIAANGRGAIGSRNPTDNRPNTVRKTQT
jgi:hypothetical protein